MSIDVKMPKLSDSMEEGTIVRWLKGPGDAVAAGEPLAEVETDKADVELEAADSGTLAEILVEQGQSAGVGDVIARLSAGGEAADGGSAPVARHEAAAAQAPPERAEEAAEPEEAEREEKAAKPIASGEAAGARAERAGAEKARRPAPVRASPLAWRLAEERHVDLTTIEGSGPGGRILKRDVEAAGRAASRREPPRSGARSPESRQSNEEPAAPPPTAGTRVEELSRMRKSIARRMTEAKRDIPHFYVGTEIDMSEAMRLREAIKRSGAIAGLTVTHLLIKALAAALERHPRVNASWREDGVQLHDDVNVGIAVALDDGLVVPVVHRAQQLTLDEVARRAGELVERARTGKFAGDDLSGATISISNVGMFDVDELVAVINPPHAAILAVAAIRERPVVREGRLAVAKTMHATLSCDHRVLNGVEGARFLAELKSILENPVSLILE